MQCFVHHDAVAVGICKACGRAVCVACARAGEDTLSCSERCASRSAMIVEMERRGARMYGLSGEKRMLPLGAVIWGLFAVLFLGSGVLSWMKTGKPEAFLLGFGVISVVVAALAYQRNKRLGLNC